ncbi:hypothetical protein D1872_306480 [compost metagenome]
MHQQLARPGRIGRVVSVPLLKRADVHVVDVNFAVSDRRERVADVHPGVPDRLDLGPGQHHARFVRILDEIVMGSFFVLGQHLAVIFLRHGSSSSSSLNDN